MSRGDANAIPALSLSVLIIVSNVRKHPMIPSAQGKVFNGLYSVLDSCLSTFNHPSLHFKCSFVALEALKCNSWNVYYNVAVSPVSWNHLGRQLITSLLLLYLTGLCSLWESFWNLSGNPLRWRGELLIFLKLRHLHIVLWPRKRIKTDIPQQRGFRTCSKWLGLWYRCMSGDGESSGSSEGESCQRKARVQDIK